jgi:hypothetical protein
MCSISRLVPITALLGVPLILSGIGLPESQTSGEYLLI